MKPIPRMSSVDTLERLAMAGYRGKDWYHTATYQVDCAARCLGIEPRRLADLLALYSPRVTVKKSIEYAVHYARTGEHHHQSMRHIREHVNRWEIEGTVNGPKTGAFAAALDGDQAAIVLDVWMARAFKIDHKQLARAIVRERCSHRIRQVAERLGWTPAETQAAIWYGAYDKYRAGTLAKEPGTIFLAHLFWGENFYGTFQRRVAA